MNSAQTSLPALKTQSERLKWARGKFYKSPRAAAQALDWNENTYKSHENAIRRADGLTLDDARRYSRAFQVPLDWLLIGTTKGYARPEIPVLGKAAAGPDGDYFDSYEIGAYPTLDIWPEEDDVAVEVEGVSMIPRFRPREKIVFGAQRQDVLPLLGQEVLAALTDGRRLIKVLRRSAENGKWDLYSINTAYSVIEGVELLWVRPFKGLWA